MTTTTRISTAERLRKLAFAHQVVDVGAFKTRLAFNFIEPQDAAFTCRQYMRLRHGGHS